MPCSHQARCAVCLVTPAPAWAPPAPEPPALDPPAGGYTAVDPTTVPSSVTAAVAAAFEANTSLVYNGQPYGACPNIVVVPDQACSQVVAGTLGGRAGACPLSAAGAGCWAALAPWPPVQVSGVRAACLQFRGQPACGG